MPPEHSCLGLWWLPPTFAQLSGALGALGSQLLQALSSTVLRAVLNTEQALSQLTHSVLTGNL